MITYLIRYGEIALKGHNRPDFEHQLSGNIISALHPHHIKIKSPRGQLLVTFPDDLSTDHVTTTLSKIFGITWFAPVTLTPPTIKDITDHALNLTKNIITSDSSFAIRAHRQTQTAFNSQSLAVSVGSAVQTATKSRVDLTNPDHTLYIDVSDRTAYLYLNKTPGPSGLPVGTSGKALVLLSGGYDSIAASYLTAKRGVSLDFLHFHTYPRPDQAVDSKITTIAEHLIPYTRSKFLYLASYTPFQMACLTLPHALAKSELVVFRRLMAMVGELVAIKFGYQALIFGDNLGQVASQTIENLSAVNLAANLPIFRPLLTYDKNDTIKLVDTLHLSDLVNQPYKDCCSLISKSPATKANLDRVKQLEELINLPSIAQQISETIFSHKITLKANS